MNDLAWIGAGLSTVLALALVVQHRPAVVAQALDTARCSDPSRRGDQRLLVVLVVTVWAYGFVTNYLRVLGGRQDRIVVRTDVAATGLASYATTALLALTVALSLLLALRSVRRSASRSTVPLLLLLLPFVAVGLANYANGRTFGTDFVAYALVVWAIWLAGADVRALRALGIVSVLAAVLSVEMALRSEDLGTIPAPITGEKEMWPNLLAGPYGHSNVLGLALSLGLPFLVLIRSRTVLVLALSTTMLAVVWSGNRNSIVAGLVSLGVLWLLRSGRGRHATVAAAVAGAVLVVLTPLRTHGFSAFSGRGAIWHVSLEAWADQPVFGWGDDFYRQLAATVSVAGEQAFNGHNVMVHALTTGGLLLAGAVVLLHCRALWDALRLHEPARAVMVAFVVDLVFNAWLQNETTYAGLNQLAYITWLPLALLLCQRPTLVAVPGDEPARVVRDDRVLTARRGAPGS